MLALKQMTNHCEALMAPQLSGMVPETSDLSGYTNAYPFYASIQLSILSPLASFRGRVFTTQVNEHVQISWDAGETLIAEQICRISEDQVCITLLDCDHSIFYDGRILKQGMLHICSGRDVHLVAREHVSGFVIAIDKRYFQHIAGQAGLELGQNNRVFDCYLQLQQEQTDALVGLLGGLVGLKESSRQRQQMMADVFGLICEATPVSSCADEFSTRSYIVDKACKIIRDNHADCDFGISELVSRLRTSRRSLQYSFQDVLGISPATYLRYVRLNAARNRLLAEGGDQINQIAIDSGFSHFSRFSQYYKGFFGELPSQTLRNSISKQH